ncbi:hypothetical protein KL938_000003 [Ogataea parapolymorpha]|nr:hypothetical protein KL938_000003 [Ogataea parapolymorpha]
MNDSFRSSKMNNVRLYQPSNQLVIIVSKAQDLPNRKKLDKQSPYCVARIQDQVQKTKIVPRGGQNPHFDDELWFSLDNVEETTVNFIVYHQMKKDSELVCKADIDFTPALRRSSKEGYDNWFPLSYNGRPAGKIYLEMTYYSSSKDVPAHVEPLTKLRMVSSALSHNIPSTQPTQATQPSNCDGENFKELNDNDEDREVKRAGRFSHMSQSFETEQSAIQRFVKNAWKFSSPFNKPVTQASVADLKGPARQPQTHLLTHKLFEDSSDEDELESANYCDSAKENQAEAHTNPSNIEALRMGKIFLSNLVFDFDKRENSGKDNSEPQSNSEHTFPLSEDKEVAVRVVSSDVDQEGIAPEPPSHRVPLTQMNRPIYPTDSKRAYHRKSNEYLGSNCSRNPNQDYDQRKSNLSYSQIRKLQRKR